MKTDVISQNDYYPLRSVHTEFGILPCSEYSELPNRHEASNEYRWGFNGMEKDDEVSGEGNSYDFGARLYNSRIGRWLSIDSKASKQPGWSPYKAMKDNPIIYKDPDGNDEIIVIKIHIGGYIYTLERNTNNNRVMTDGELKKEGLSPGYFIYFNYSSTYNLYVNDNGQITATYEGKSIRPNELKDTDLYVLEKPPKGEIKWHCDKCLTGEGENQKGGFRFTSKEKGSDQTKTNGTGKNITSVEADHIINAMGLGGAKGTGSPKKAIDWIKLITDGFAQGETVGGLIEDGLSEGGNDDTEDGGANSSDGGSGGSSYNKGAVPSYDKDKNRYHIEDEDTLYIYPNRNKNKKGKGIYTTPSKTPSSK